MVFAKSYCPVSIDKEKSAPLLSRRPSTRLTYHSFVLTQHCKRTRALLEELHTEMNKGWKYDTVDLDLMSDGDGPKLQAELLRLTGQRTVPNIFVGGTHVGGNSDLQALHHQQLGLTPMLEALASVHDGEDL